MTLEYRVAPPWPAPRPEQRLTWGSHCGHWESWAQDDVCCGCGILVGGDEWGRPCYGPRPA